jgi:hypothetical protein
MDEITNTVCPAPRFFRGDHARADANHYDRDGLESE